MSWPASWTYKKILVQLMAEIIRTPKAHKKANLFFYLIHDIEGRKWGKSNLSFFTPLHIQPPWHLTNDWVLVATSYPLLILRAFITETAPSPEMLSHSLFSFYTVKACIMLVMSVFSVAERKRSVAFEACKHQQTIVLRSRSLFSNTALQSIVNILTGSGVCQRKGLLINILLWLGCHLGGNI